MFVEEGLFPHNKFALKIIHCLYIQYLYEEGDVCVELSSYDIYACIMYIHVYTCIYMHVHVHVYTHVYIDLV